MRSDNPGLRFWRSQLPVDFIDATIVINAWETVEADLSEGLPARLWHIEVEQTNNGAAAEDLEFEITINGTAYTVTLSGIASGVISYIHVSNNLSGGDFLFLGSTQIRTVGTFVNFNAIPFNAASVELIRVRQTTAVDVVSAQIEVNMKWDKLVNG